MGIRRHEQGGVMMPRLESTARERGNGGRILGSIAGLALASGVLGFATHGTLWTYNEEADGSHHLVWYPDQQEAEASGLTPATTLPTETAVPGTTVAPPQTTTATEAAPVPATAAAVARNPSVVIIGDSITVMRFSAGHEAEKIGAAGLDLIAHDEKGARPLVWGPCNTDSQSLACEGDRWIWNHTTHSGAGDGPTSLKRLAPQVAAADVVFLALGTNTTEASLAADMERVVTEAWSIANQDGKPAAIVMPSMFHTRDDYVGPANERNDIMHQEEARLREQGIDIRVVDYQAAQVPLSDGLHPKDTEKLTDYDVSVLVPIATEIRDKVG